MHCTGSVPALVLGFYGVCMVTSHRDCWQPSSNVVTCAFLLSLQSCYVDRNPRGVKFIVVHCYLYLVAGINVARIFNWGGGG